MSNSEAVIQDKLLQPAIAISWTLDLKSAGEYGAQARYQDTTYGVAFSHKLHVYNQKISTNLFSLPTHMPDIMCYFKLMLLYHRHDVGDKNKVYLVQ